MDEPRQFLIYQSEDGSTRIDVMLEAETLWLNQKQLTELFGKAKGTISEHIKHIFEDGEPDENSSVRFFRTVQAHGICAHLPRGKGDAVLSGGDAVARQRKTTVFDLHLTAIMKQSVRHSP